MQIKRTVPNYNPTKMKKIALLLTSIFFYNIAFSQNDQSRELSRLFLDLKLEAPVKDITSGSKLKFELSESEDAKTYVALFNEHKLIQSKILSGECTIYQKNKNLSTGEYVIDHKITFKTLEEVIKVYNELSKDYDPFAISILESTGDGDTINQAYQNKVIRMESKTKQITLTFMYPIPAAEQTEYNLYIICQFKKLWYK